MSQDRTRTDVPPELAGTDEMRIYEHDRPGLEANDYHIEITETLTGAAHASFPTDKHIAVEGDRFSLAPDRIHSFYPPNSAHGDYWHVLPHIVLNRPTLPWERSADDRVDDKNRRPPWLRLLLFDEDDLDDVERKVVTLGTLVPRATGVQPSWPGVTLGSSQHRDDQVVVIDVPFATALAQMPAKTTDQTLTSHVRRVSPLKLHHRIYSTQSLGEQIHALSTSWFDPILSHLFGAEGLAPGDLSQFNWHGGSTEEHIWKFTIPGVGVFEACVVKGGQDTGLMFSGGPLAATGPTQDAIRHGFSLVETDLESAFHSIGHGHLSHWLIGIVRATGLDLRSPRVETEEAGQQWRVMCAETGLHLILRKQGKMALEIHSYCDVQSEAALIVGNRLPAPGKRCVMHLVSIEDRFTTSGRDRRLTLQDTGADTTEKLRFVSLKSWEFQCSDRKADFAGVLEQINRDEDTGIEGSPALALPFSGEALGGKDEAAKVAARLANGDIPLRHKMRRGDRTVSWYRGPLVPEVDRGTRLLAKLPVAASDALVQFDEDLGMFDVSYAAAWELGRLTMLADTQMATKLYQWKRSHAHQLAAARERADFGVYLPLAHRVNDPSAAAQVPVLPADLAAWFNDLSLLKRIPYRYLVPDETLLANNALKFFTLDPVWLACLRDGAFSIGRVMQGDHQADLHRQRALGALPTISGFLLRSEVVQNFPDLATVAYGSAPDPESAEALSSHPTLPILPCLRQERLGKYVMLSLFDGSVQTLDLHRAPQTLHFGFNQPDLAQIRDPHLRERLPREIARHNTAALCKTLRGRGGDMLSGAMIESELLNQKEGIPINEARVVDFTKLSARMAGKLEQDGRLVTAHGLNPAKFAMEMMEGADLVRFLRAGSPGSGGGGR